MHPQNFAYVVRGKIKDMEKVVKINGHERTINVDNMYIIGVVRTGINVNGMCYNYSFVCSNNGAVESVDDILNDIGTLSMFANDVRIPITDARLRQVKTLAASAPKVSEDTPEALLTAWDKLIETQFIGKTLNVKRLTASVNELTNGEHDAYTLKFDDRVIENVTARTVAYIDDDTAAYERLRKQVLADIANEEEGES